MRRRKWIMLVGSAAAVSLTHWSMVTHAQQQVQPKRIGILMNFRERDAEGHFTASVHALTDLGWTDGRNARLDVRWSEGEVEHFRRYARELVALAPDVILAASSIAVTALRPETHAVPIVFAGVVDPVGAGFVESSAGCRHRRRNRPAAVSPEGFAKNSRATLTVAAAELPIALGRRSL
jgi:putative tryptophan/tyrosine transport system substrate-binding protein